MLYLGLIVTSCRCLGFLSVTVLYLHSILVSRGALLEGLKSLLTITEVVPSKFLDSV